YRNQGYLFVTNRLRAMTTRLYTMTNRPAWIDLKVCRKMKTAPHGLGGYHENTPSDRFICAFRDGRDRTRVKTLAASDRGASAYGHRSVCAHFERWISRTVHQE